MTGKMRPSELKKDVPAHLARKIGQIIVRYAYLDYRLKLVIWKLSNVDSETGRLAIRDPRALDKLELIRDLFHHLGRPLDEGKFQEVKKVLCEVEQFRDLLAHGVWTEHEGQWAVVKFRGKITAPDLQPIEKKREFKPEAFTATVSGLAETLATIDSVLAAVLSLDRLSTSQKKPPPLFDPEDHHN